MEIDVSAIPPLCDEAEFERDLQSMAEDEAPRRFAVVQELGTRVDARVVAWGMAFPDHMDVVSVSGSMRMRVSRLDLVLLMFREPNVTAHIRWIDAERPDWNDEESDDSADPHRGGGNVS